MNPAERRNALLFAVGAPVVGLLLAGGANLATAVGPATLVDNWAGRALLTILGLAGYGLVLFTQLRYFNLIVFFGAFFTFFIGLTMITNVIEEHALQARGATVTCAVLHVDRRVETRTDSEGHTTNRIFYDHELDCLEAPVTELITASRVAAKGEQLDIRYDPAGRVDPRPAAGLGDQPGPLWPGFALFGGGMLLRLLYEWKVPGFSREWGFGIDRWRRWRRRRQSRPGQ